MTRRVSNCPRPQVAEFDLHHEAGVDLEADRGRLAVFVARVLRHLMAVESDAERVALGLDADAVPRAWLEQVSRLRAPGLFQARDDRNVFQASPDELPVIDIHSL